MLLLFAHGGCEADFEDKDRLVFRHRAVTSITLRPAVRQCCGLTGESPMAAVRLFLKKMAGVAQEGLASAAGAIMLLTLFAVLP